MFAYLAAELSQKADSPGNHLPSVSFVVSLILIAGLELIADLYLLVCINAESNGSSLPLRESLLIKVEGKLPEAADPIIATN